jgi:hypothetical protein
MNALVKVAAEDRFCYDDRCEGLVDDERKRKERDERERELLPVLYGSVTKTALVVACRLCPASHERTTRNVDRNNELERALYETLAAFRSQHNSDSLR